MRNEIAAGTKVGVLITRKGVTTIQDAEVLAHMDGLVHVNIDGEAISVDPAQIVSPDATVNGPADQSADLDEIAGRYAAKFIAALEPLSNRVAELESAISTLANSGYARIEALETRVLAMDADIARLEGLIAGVKVAPVDAPALSDPAAPAEPAPAVTENETTSTTGSTAAAESGEPAAGN